MQAILNFLPYVGYIVLALMILVFIHELGHFLAALLFKMRVDKFSIGFPPKIVGKTIGETEYVIGATPLGGYVKIAGMVDESLDTDGLESEPQPWEFRAKPVWQRIIVIVAGVVFNMLLAWGIFAALAYTNGDAFVPADKVTGVYVMEGSTADKMGIQTGDRIVQVGQQTLVKYDELERLLLLADPLTVTVERKDSTGAAQTVTLTGPADIITQMNRSQGDFGLSIEPPLIGNVAERSPADSAGLQPGDRIVAVDSAAVHYWMELGQNVQAAHGAPVTVRIARADTAAADTAKLTLVSDTLGVKTYDATVTPRFEAADSTYKLGVGSPTGEQLIAEFGVQRTRYSLSQAIGKGWAQTGTATKLIVTSLTRVFSGRDAARENLGGMFQVAKQTREAARAGWGAFWGIVAMLSVTLAVMNILPIPALDGGHLMFLIYEGVMRRKPSLKVQTVMQYAGMAILLVLMAFLLINDAVRMFGG
ncbi:MAG: RIP metalloprotease RseP [Bacteroidetes bacterium]|nr:RIP metalloprotease RseP [Bacteroidota bacterium]